MSSHRDLSVWQILFVVTEEVYKLCRKLPRSEQFGLVSQLQLSAVSLPSNIAEGQQRNGQKKFK